MLTGHASPPRRCRTPQLRALARELEKTEPAAVDAIVAMMAAHLRSWKPLALLAAQVTP